MTQVFFAQSDLAKPDVPASTLQPKHADGWQRELQDAISDVRRLYELLELPVPDKYHAPHAFTLRVPMSFVKKMQKGRIDDPLLRQVLPDLAEMFDVVGYTHDPLDEQQHNPIKGLLHKYQNRALVTVTGACAVHCRYCFRQHFDYGANLPTTETMRAIADYLASDIAINEVLLSGGDPLNISNRRLGQWFEMLSGLDNVKTIRLHTRLPVVLPSRIDDGLLAMLKACPKKVVMVLHINHANEIDDTLTQKCKLLIQHGVTLLNQSVLLKGVNDDAKTLATLSHALFAAGILPYYLHILDKVKGAAHFDLPIERAVEIYWQLLEQLSGYLVPKLVQEVAGKPYKTPVDIYRYRLCGE